MMSISAFREMAYDRNSACLIASMLFGIVSLYTGLFGAGAKGSVMVSAVTGTCSLALAVVYVLRLLWRVAAVANSLPLSRPAVKLSASKSAQNRELILSPPEANIPTISEVNFCLWM
jgi:high-affinity Fe2+/Pb2+ permease